MYKILIAALLLCSCAGSQKLTVANGHSHNDYEQARPFFEAYEAGFGSIEADIFLENGQLYVAHDTVELKAHKRLTELYLDPLLAATQANNGQFFAGKNNYLQVLIDIKTNSVNTLKHLIAELQHYQRLIQNNNLRFVITGNRPASETFVNYPAYIWFDGELHKTYSAPALSKIVMFSDNIKRYTQWRGKGAISKPERKVLEAAIRKSHKLRKPVRFWDAPDFESAWGQLQQLGVDYINTDHIQLLRSYFKPKA